MSLAICNTTVDEHGLELVQHGTTDFPIACYHDNLGEMEVPWHWHEELEAAVITEGCALVAAGNEKYTVHAGEGIVINSGILHGAWDVDASGCRFHSMVFHPRLVGGSIDSVFYQNYIIPLQQNRNLESLHLKPEVPWQTKVLEAVESAWQACVNEPDGYEFRVRNELSDMVFLLQSNLPAVRQTISSKVLRNGERIKLMLQYIHDSFAEELNTAKIAESASISESECLRCFRATIGTTPIQYVRKYRIQRAAQLLAGTREQIADIATQCGFQDISYFTKTFREIMGVVPTEYRRENEKGTEGR